MLPRESNDQVRIDHLLRERLREQDTGKDRKVLKGGKESVTFECRVLLIWSVQESCLV